MLICADSCSHKVPDVSQIKSNTQSSGEYEQNGDGINVVISSSYVNECVSMPVIHHDCLSTLALRQQTSGSVAHGTLTAG